MRSRHVRTHGMTLVDVLAAIAILTVVVSTLAPLAVEARAGLARSDERLDLLVTLARIEPPTEPVGERQESSLPRDCRLRWYSATMSMPSTGSAAQPAWRLVTMQIVTGHDSALRVVAERTIPLSPVPP